MPDASPALPMPIAGMVALLLAGLALYRSAGFLAINLFVLLTMRPGRRYYGWRWNVVRRWVYKRDHYECRECRRGRLQLHCHHKRPVAQGGSSFTWNLETLCADDHARRHPGNSGMWR